MPEAQSTAGPQTPPSSFRRVAMEAELQARLEGRIRAVLPLLPADIKLEHYLNLRLGHHAVLIDGADPERQLVKGRYDLLVLYGGKTLLLVELKAPNVPVDETDVGQALSYARLHDPPVPLVLITNGIKTVLKRTYDGEELAADDVAGERLGAVLKAAATVAAAHTEDAVRTLLGCSKDSWSEILEHWNTEFRVGLTGPIEDFRKPIAQEFIVPREAVSHIERILASGSRVVAVHGPPLSGVTSVLAQLSNRLSLGPVLFVTRDAPDVLLHIANRLSRELSFPISKDSVRGWLNTGRGLSQVTVVTDGLPLAIDELVDFANAGLLRVIVGLGTDQFQDSSSVSGRVQQTAFGRHASVVTVGAMSDAEFAAAGQLMIEQIGAEFPNGAQHIPSLRWPRTLRVLCAMMGKRARPPAAGTLRMIRPFVGPEILAACGEAFVPDPSFRFDWTKVARAYLDDFKSNAGKPEWLSATWGRPSVDPDTLEQMLGKPRFDMLREQGFLSWIDTSIGPRVAVRIEELLSHFVAEEWAGSLAQLRKDERLREKLDELLGYAALMPLGDAALASAIVRATQRNGHVLGVALPHLVGHEPTTSKISAGSLIQPLFIDREVRISVKDNLPQETVGNLHPWLVASHLASIPMEAVGFQRTANYSIFAQIGNSKHLIYAPAPTDIGGTPGFHFHDIPGMGSFPCLSTGIIEPLTQAMLEHAWSYPNEFIDLANLAVEGKMIHLAWRILSVIPFLKEATAPAVAAAGVSAEAVLRAWWDSTILDALKCHAD